MSIGYIKYFTLSLGPCSNLPHVSIVHSGKLLFKAIDWNIIGGTGGNDQ